MEDKKYYTPELSELHIGFEYEVKLNGGTQWAKLTFKPTTRFDTLENKALLIRVKHLDHDDILSLEWDKSDIDDNLYKMFFFNNNHDLEFHIELIFCNSMITIKTGIGNVLFSGHLLNKSELSRLMRQLGITKSK